MNQLNEDLAAVAEQSGGAVQPDPLLPFNLRNQQLAQRRRLAEQLVMQGLAGNGGQGYHSGRVFMVGNQLGNIAKSLGGAYLQSQAEKDATAAELAQRAAMNDFTANWQNATPEQREALLQTARNQGLDTGLERDLLKQQSARLERGEQLAADRQAREQLAREAQATREQDREDRQQFQASQNEMYKRTAAQMVAAAGAGRGGASRAKPPSGYRWNEDGTELEAIPGGPRDASNAPAKPLSAAQEKAALELGSNQATLASLADSFQDEYSGDLRVSARRAAGKVLGGAADDKTQALTRWWADQAYFDELPKRHELFGAALTPTEQRSWASASISPSDSPKTIRDRLATRQRIYDEVATRLRGSVVAAGRSGKQFDAATGRTGAPQQSGAWDDAKERRYQEWKARNGK